MSPGLLLIVGFASCNTSRTYFLVWAPINNFQFSQTKQHSFRNILHLFVMTVKLACMISKSGYSTKTAQLTLSSSLESSAGEIKFLRAHKSLTVNIESIVDRCQLNGSDANDRKLCFVLKNHLIHTTAFRNSYLVQRIYSRLNKLNKHLIFCPFSIHCWSLGIMFVETKQVSLKRRCAQFYISCEEENGHK